MKTICALAHPAGTSGVLMDSPLGAGPGSNPGASIVSPGVGRHFSQSSNCAVTHLICRCFPQRSVPSETRNQRGATYDDAGLNFFEVSS